jgi:hypothetical protein
MKKWKQIVAAFVVTLGLGGGMLAFSEPVSAVNVFEECGASTDAAVCKAQNTDNVSSMMKTIINILLFLIGTIAVIMIIVGGIRYTLSNGNASQVKEAKDTILYSVIGLIIAIMSYAIVNFVISWF